MQAPKGTLAGLRFQNAQEAAEYLLLSANISVVPWDDCGAYLRFSVTFEATGKEEEQGIIEDFYRRVKPLNLIFQ